METGRTKCRRHKKKPEWRAHNQKIIQKRVKNVLGKMVTNVSEKVSKQEHINLNKIDGGYIKTSKGKRKVRTGKRGGKYIMMGGKKKYLK